MYLAQTTQPASIDSHLTALTALIVAITAFIPALIGLWKAFGAKSAAAGAQTTATAAQASAATAQTTADSAKQTADTNKQTIDNHDGKLFQLAKDMIPPDTLTAMKSQAGVTIPAPVEVLPIDSAPAASSKKGGK